MLFRESFFTLPWLDIVRAASTGFALGWAPLIAGILSGVSSLVKKKGEKQNALAQFQNRELDYKRGWTANKEAGRQSYLRDIASPGNARFRMGSLLGLGRLYGAMGGKGKGPATLIKYFEQMRNPYEYVEPTYLAGTAPKTGLGWGDFASALVQGAGTMLGAQQGQAGQGNGTFNVGSGGGYTYKNPWDVGPPEDLMGG